MFKVNPEVRQRAEMFAELQNLKLSAAALTYADENAVNDSDGAMIISAFLAGALIGAKMALATIKAGAADRAAADDEEKTHV